MRTIWAAVLATLVLMTCPSQASDLVGSWEGQYFCNAPNPVGRLKIRIVNEGGRLVAHESYARGSNSGTVVYRVEQHGPDRFRLSLDRDRTRDFAYSYYLDYLITSDGTLAGQYVGHRNCQRTSLASTSPRSQTAEKVPTARKQADSRPSTPAATKDISAIADKVPPTRADARDASPACDDDAIRFTRLNPYQRGAPHIKFLVESAQAAVLVPICERAESGAVGEAASAFSRRKYLALFAAGKRDEPITGLIAMRDTGDHRAVWHLAALYYATYLEERQAGRQTKAIEAYAASLEHYRRAADLYQSQALPQGDLIALYLAYMYSGGPYRFDPATVQYGDPVKAVEFGDRAIAHVQPEVMAGMAHLIGIFVYDYRAKFSPELLARAHKSRIAWLQTAANAGHRPSQAELKAIADDEKRRVQSRIDQKHEQQRKEDDKIFKRTHREIPDRNVCIRRERGTIFNTLTLRNSCQEALIVYVCKRSVAGTLMRELANAWQMGQTYCETRTAMAGHSIDTVYVPNVDNLLASVTLGSDQFTAFACSTATIMRFGKCWSPGKPFMVAFGDLVSQSWKPVAMGLLLLIALGAAVRARKSSVPPAS